MESNQNELKKKVKTNKRMMWILIGVIFISLIAFVVIICKNRFSPLEAAIPWIIIICSFIAIFVLNKIGTPMYKKEREEHIREIEDSNILKHLSYSAHTKTLTVTKKSKFIGEFLKAEPIYVNNYSKKPDSYILTSATVGGVTTGGIEKVEGKNKTRKRFSGQYKLYYRRMTENGGFVKEGEIEYIELSDDLLQKAWKDIDISNYIFGDKISILDKEFKAKMESAAGIGAQNMMLKSTLEVGGNTLLGNYSEYMNILEYPDSAKISKIRNWLMDE